MHGLHGLASAVCAPELVLLCIMMVMLACQLSYSSVSLTSCTYSYNQYVLSLSALDVNAILSSPPPPESKEPFCVQGWDKLVQLIINKQINK